MPARKAVKETKKLMQSLGVTNMKELRDLKRLIFSGSAGGGVGAMVSKALESKPKPKPEPKPKQKPKKAKDPEAKLIRIKNKDTKGKYLKMKNGGIVRKVGGGKVKCRLTF